MSEATIAAHYVQGFRANLNMVPQQMDRRLVGSVEADLSYSEPGKSFNSDFIGTSTPSPVTGRAPDSPNKFLENTRRGGHFSAIADGVFIDNLDKARMLADPSNKTMQAIIAGKNRAIDDKIISAATGVAYSGENLTTSNAFDSTYSIAADDRTNLHDAEVVGSSGDLGLTVGKLITAWGMLERSEIEGPRFMWVTSHQLEQLLASTPVTSGDYNNIRALVNGQVNSLFGFNFIRTERLAVASGIRTCIAMVKPAIEFKMREIVQATIDRRADKSFRWYAYWETEYAACRVLDQGVIKVLCKDAVTA